MYKLIDGKKIYLSEVEILEEQQRLEITPELKASTNRIERNYKLVESDWTQISDHESGLTSEQVTEYATYRQALRDLPTHANWPNLEEEDWPTKP